MADTSLNENRLALLIWQTSNLWQSKVRHKLKDSQITLNEYLILETIYLLQQENTNITQQDICKNASIDRSVVSLRVSNLEEKKLISKQQPQDKRSDSLILTAAGNDLINNIIDNIVDLENELFNKLGSEIFNFTNSLKLLLGKKIRIRAKLNDCSKEELEEFERLNADYKKKFGFPFIIAVKGKNKSEILNNFRHRIKNNFKIEFDEAKIQVKKIASARLEEILEI